MKISYAVTVCNEFTEIQKLIPYLLDNIRPDDEIVVLYDSKNGDEKVEEYLRAKSVNPTYSWHSGEFDGHFADWKNKLTDLCNGDYIFQIDADEIPNEELIQNLPQILEMNSVDVILVPRVNLVDGLTDEYIKKWNWVVDDKGRVNWPDPQWRVYKKSESIRWTNKVHEKLVGYDTISNLPWVEELALFHHKDIEKQIKQNDYYDTLV
jgi:hypothetical protein|tara:strand:+ start:1808 stop:2431 length:624 start_codon:yes stop_codon:yes gene_type:complete